MRNNSKFILGAIVALLTFGGLQVSVGKYIRAKRFHSHHQDRQPCEKVPPACHRHHHHFH